MARDEGTPWEMELSFRLDDWGAQQAQQQALLQQRILGGYEIGEKVFYTGETFTRFSFFADAEKFVYGQQGVVVGPATDGTAGVAVHFPGNQGSVNCFFAKVCHPHLRPRRCPRPVRYSGVSVCRSALALTA